jgi:hypothetical protein
MRNFRKKIYLKIGIENLRKGGKGISRTYALFFAEFLQEPSLVSLGTLTPAYLSRFAVRSHPNLSSLELF